MSEHLSEELIALFTSGWASRAELARVVEHVEGCRACLHRVDGTSVAGTVFVPASSQNEAYVTMTEKHWEGLKAKVAEKPAHRGDQLRFDPSAPDDGLTHAVAIFGALESKCGKRVAVGSACFGADGVPEGATADHPPCPACTAENKAFVEADNKAMDELEADRPADRIADLVYSRARGRKRAADGGSERVQRAVLATVKKHNDRAPGESLAFALHYLAEQSLSTESGVTAALAELQRRGFLRFEGCSEGAANGCVCTPEGAVWLGTPPWVEIPEALRALFEKAKKPPGGLH